VPVIARVREPALAASRPLTRAVAFATAAVPVSVGGHLAGGGSIPDDATLLMAAAMMIVAYRVVLAARERSWPVISLALGVCECVLHALFGAGSPMMMESGSTAGHRSARMLMPAGMGGSTATAVHAHLAPGLVMLAGHAAAALLLGWALRQGERVLWAAARRTAVAVLVVVRPLATLLALAPASVGPVSRRFSGPAPALVTGRYRYLRTGGRRWRAPPARLASAA
jgi:hypothetical protein